MAKVVKHARNGPEKSPEYVNHRAGEWEKKSKMSSTRPKSLDLEGSKLGKLFEPAESSKTFRGKKSRESSPTEESSASESLFLPTPTDPFVYENGNVDPYGNGGVRARCACCEAVRSETMKNREIKDAVRAAFLANLKKLLTSKEKGGFPRSCDASPTLEELGISVSVPLAFASSSTDQQAKQTTAQSGLISKCVNRLKWHKTPLKGKSKSGEEAVEEEDPKSSEKVEKEQSETRYHTPFTGFRLQDRILTRFLAQRVQEEDNELYRSNSFKFQRPKKPEGQEEPRAVSPKIQVGLNETYSQPLDLVVRRSLGDIRHDLPLCVIDHVTGEEVSIDEDYSEPQDVKAYLQPGDDATGKLYTVPDDDYTQPYVCAHTIQGSRVIKGEQDDVYEDVEAPEETILVSCEAEGISDADRLRIHVSDPFSCPWFDCPSLRTAEGILIPVHHSDLLEDEDDCSLFLQDENFNFNCLYDSSSDLDSLEELDMSGRQRRLYETAFDSKITAKTPVQPRAVDDIDEICNHPILQDLSPFQTPRNTPRLVRAVSQDAAGMGAARDKRKVKLIKERRISRASSLFGSRIFVHFGRDKSSSDLKRKSMREGSSMPELDLDCAEDKVEEVKDGDQQQQQPEITCFKERLHDTNATSSSILHQDQQQKQLPPHPVCTRLSGDFHKLQVSSEKSCSDTQVIIHEEPGSSPCTPPPRKSLPSDEVLHTPSPPSTAPLPVKFRPGAKMNSMRSAPHIPTSSPRNKLDLNVSPANRSRERAGNGSPKEQLNGNENRTIVEIKSRTDSHRDNRARFGARPKFASFESVSTSSSSTVSSLESIRSSSSSSDAQSSSCSSSVQSQSSGSSRSVSSQSSASEPSSSSRSEVSSEISNRCDIRPHFDKNFNAQSDANKTTLSLSLGNRGSGGTEIGRTKKPSPIIEDVRKEQEAEGEVDSLNVPWDMPKLKKKLQNTQLYQKLHCDIQGSGISNDSGISMESQQQMKVDDISDLPFDMPKLRRRLTLPQHSHVSQPFEPSRQEDYLEDLPFDMPKLRRRRQQSLSFSSFHTLEGSTTAHCKNLSLSFSAISPKKLKSGLALNLGCATVSARGERIEPNIPLHRQGWYHGTISRTDAEGLLRPMTEGSFLVRNSESSKQGYSLSLKSARGFMHMRIVEDSSNGKYILGQFSKPFESIPHMVSHYSCNKLPIKGAEHMSLLCPVMSQLL